MVRPQKALRRVAAGWAAPVALTLAGAEAPTVVWATVAVAGLCGMAVLVKPRTALVIIPFVALLGPLGGFITLFGLAYVVTDWLFILLCAQLVFLLLVRRGSRLSVLPATLVLCVTLSAVFAFVAGAVQSVKPILYLSQLTIVGAYTSRYAKIEEDWSLVVRSWMVATGFGVILLVHAFSLGLPLIEFDKVGGVIPVGRTEGESDRLFQATYYYAGFHFAVGISAVILALVALREKSLRRALAGALGLLVLVAVAYVMGTKTVLLGATASTAGLSLLLALRRRGARAVLRWAVAAVAALAMVWLVSGADDIGQVQVGKLGQSLTSASSLVTRVEVWESAVGRWLDAPFKVIIGLGPNFLELGEPSQTMKFKVSSVTGLPEGTVDSGWIGYLLELGCVTFLLAVILFRRSCLALWKHIREAESVACNQAPAVYVLGGLIYVSLAMVTQSLGYSKISWWPLQLVIIGLKHGQLTKHRDSHDLVGS